MKIMKAGRELTSESINAAVILSENIRKENEAQRIETFNAMMNTATVAKDGIDASIQDASALKGELDELVTTSATLKGELDSLNTLSAELEANLSEVMTTGTGLFEDVSNLKSKMTTMDKELNEYQKTMSQANVNQESTQSVTGRKTLNFPKTTANGQVSTRMTGLTSNNIVENGDFSNGIIGWAGSNINMPTVQDNEITFTATGMYGKIEQSWNNVAGDVYYFGADVKANSSSVSMYIIGDNSVIKAHSGSGEYERLSGKGTLANDSTAYVRIIDNRTSNWAPISAKNILVINLTRLFGEGNEPDLATCNRMFSHSFDGNRSALPAFRLRGTDGNGEDSSAQYIMAKSGGNIVRLRSLPSGVKDILDTELGKLIKKINDKRTVQITDIKTMYTGFENLDYAKVQYPADMKVGGVGLNIEIDGYDNFKYIDTFDDIRAIGKSTIQAEAGYIWVGFAKGTTLEQAIQSLLGVGLSYELAEPIEIPLQVYGQLISHAGGTVYIEPAVVDAGVYYNGKVSILSPELPIASIERISKVDFNTGEETELNVNSSVIAEDRLSFAHPDLVDGDVVFFTYLYNTALTTEGEVTLTYYDSRYILKDKTTGMLYRWNLEVDNGVIAIRLEEVE